MLNIPVLSTYVRLARYTSSIYDDTEKDEANHSGDLDDGEYEFSFSIAPDTEEIDAGLVNYSPKHVTRNTKHT
jgi:hypothetical protein